MATVLGGDGVDPAGALAVDVARDVVGERETSPRVLAPHALVLLLHAV
jgi:hypothetical protein